VQNRNPALSTYILATNFEPRPVFPAQPKEVGDEKRNEPAVAVLFVKAPFLAEMPATNEPKRAESEAKKQNRCSRVSMRRVLARRALLHRGYFGRVLRMQAGVSYNFCGEETCFICSRVSMRRARPAHRAVATTQLPTRAIN